MDGSKLKRELYELLNNVSDEKDIKVFCLKHHIPFKLGHTSYLYMLYSKQGVAEILDIDESTVIRRVKKFINKVKENPYGTD